MKKIVVIGASDQSRCTIDVIEQEKKYEIYGILDKKLEQGTTFEGYPVLGYLENIRELIEDNGVYGGIVAIGDNFTRYKVVKSILELRPEFNFVNAIHPSVIIGKKVRIGEGNLIMPGVILNNNSSVGDHCILLTRSSLDHDSNLGDYSSFSPGVTTGGRVNVGNCSVIGIGANILHSKSVGNHCVIGGGALINKDIEDNSVAYGVPARIVKKRKKSEKYL
ncbi:sugar O-acyltransferase, sialic acid O-acetyltransferase NeuD family [Salinimicrobium catena]|uniref:Sugar O-acyltransferase, sialic acid O-acetyltransferase NeuD family n=1 Tax=Salinimicrobium catena TaxID=390640 RepID=A0A1H5LNW2_9FLAO|nr:acetyltransferase [Salinimicrobium catena]SDL11452.1 sugar O-acyltransferase, sialic acid O-acetyltransferase NeuD family [Salinimicrobium catena]SEE77878.1 sugar O-acyltransferase, sialic acid O-acetyltransferase NeuD family [Salinimicrobium catena]